MIESIEVFERFDGHFERAISEWPEVIEIKNLIFTVDDKSLFLTSEMYDLYEEISSKHFGSDEEVFMAHLHICIYRIMHTAARFTSVIRPRDLRRSEVRGLFEDMLRTLSTEEGWRDQDFAAVDAYFAQT